MNVKPLINVSTALAAADPSSDKLSPAIVDCVVEGLRIVNVKLKTMSSSEFNRSRIEGGPLGAPGSGSYIAPLTSHVNLAKPMALVRRSPT
jgi:hypothetical protein